MVAPTGEDSKSSHILAEPFELFQVSKKKRTKCSNLSSGGDVTSSHLPPIPKSKPE